MNDVLKIDVPKVRLMAMSARERAMFLLLGHASNQVALATKLAILSTNKTPEDPVESRLSAAQSMMLLRNLIGVVHEAYVTVVQRHFLSSAQGRIYIALMDEGGQKALEALKRLFGGSGFLGKVRNEFAFHNPSDEEVEAAFQLAAADPTSDDDWHWFFSKSGWNSFHYLSEVIVMHGVLRSAHAVDFNEAQAKLKAEMGIANNEMVTLLQALTAAMWVKHIGEEFHATVAAKVEQAPGLFDFWLPFFFDVPDGPLSIG